MTVEQALKVIKRRGFFLFNVALGTVKFTADKRLSTMRCGRTKDGDWFIKYSPNYLASLTDEAVVAVLVHEMQHLTMTQSGANGKTYKSILV